MINGKKVVVVLPAYNAEKTLEKTYQEIPKDIVDEILLVDDQSSDETIKVAESLGIPTIVHAQNLGYGGNQKTCYQEALRRGADIVVMLHPDYQYPPKLVGPMASLIATGMFDVVLGSRILGGYALKGGMPIYKYIANRALTAFENILTGQKLSEYHTGFRAFSREVLLGIPLLENSDDFIFDNQILTQIFYFGYAIGEISSPCNYNKGCSSISLKRSTIYGLGVLKVAFQYALARLKMSHNIIFDNEKGKKLAL
ncbi:MAG: glycosyltransferase family 2 protein [Candidatus Omnitrophica bacterium]|nr:glycosyltransferase family 2 protein [Candidatus Omnitrophota bacterium]